MKSETKISEISIISIKPVKSLIAVASCVIDNKIYLGSIGIHMVRSGGFRITYPTKSSGSNPINIWHPVSKEAGDIIESAIINEYEKIISQNV